MTEQQRQLFEFVKRQHGTQTRKYTNAPYWQHLLNVAKIVSAYGNENYEYEIALCHDLFEDTDTTSSDLLTSLEAAGYSPGIANHILTSALELTNEYTKEKYPLLNRSERKKLEAERLGKISAVSQNVKLADFIDNTPSIEAYYDASFLKVYLKEQDMAMSYMTKTNFYLTRHCLSVYASAMRTVLRRLSRAELWNNTIL